MITQQKYLLALTISHVLSALIAMNGVNCDLDFIMYAYIFLPVVALVAAGAAYRYLKSGLIYIPAFAILMICCFMFWSNDNIVKEVYLYRANYGCIIYIAIMLLSAIGMPLTKPNDFIGVRIPQTEGNPEVWRRTHIFTSVLLSSLILPTFIIMLHYEFKDSFVWCNVFLFGAMAIGIVYGVIIAMPIEKNEKRQIEKELKEQIKKEQGYR